MVKSKTGDTWSIIQPKIVNNQTKKIANVTSGTFKLVKDKSTGAWKLVAPVMNPTGKFLQRHTVNIGKHTLRFAWNKTNHAWNLISPHISNGIGYTMKQTGKLWDSTHE